MKEKDIEIIKTEVKTHIDEAMERYVVSKYQEWSGLMTSIKDELAEQRGDIKLIKEQINPLISEAEFWNQLWKRVRTGGNLLTWIVGVIAAILILSGQAKTLLLAWLASRTL